MRLYDPFDLMRPSLEIAEIFTEAQVVIGLRLAGFAGLWPMAQTEAAPSARAARLSRPAPQPKSRRCCPCSE